MYVKTMPLNMIDCKPLPHVKQYYIVLSVQDDMAPDYARTINIHEKPGYDPCEMLLSSSWPTWLSKLHLLSKVVLSTLCRIRTLIDATPFDSEAANSIRGSHGTVLDTDSSEGMSPLLFSSIRTSLLENHRQLSATQVYDVLLQVIKSPNSAQTFEA